MATRVTHSGKIVQCLSNAQTMGFDSIPLGEWTYVSPTSVLWPSSAGEGLAIGRSLAQDAPPTVYKQAAEIRTTPDSWPQCLVTSYRRRNREYKLCSSLRNFRKSLISSYIISNRPILVKTQFYNKHVTGPLNHRNAYRY